MEKNQIGPNRQNAPQNLSFAVDFINGVLSRQQNPTKIPGDRILAANKKNLADLSTGS